MLQAKNFRFMGKYILVYLEITLSKMEGIFVCESMKGYDLDIDLDIEFYIKWGNQLSEYFIRT